MAYTSRPTTTPLIAPLPSTVSLIAPLPSDVPIAPLLIRSPNAFKRKKPRRAFTYTSDNMANTYHDLYILGDEERASLTTHGYIRINLSIQIPMDVIQLCFKFYCKKLIFPLTDQQLQIRKNYVKFTSRDNYIFSAMDDSKHKDHISLLIPDDIDFVTAIRGLQSKMGVRVLLNTDEISQIRGDIKGQKKRNTEQNINVDQLSMLKMNDRDFFNHMMLSVENGFQFIRYRKGGVSSEIFVVIHKNRLYWKQNPKARNIRSRSFRLDKITSIVIGEGKHSKYLKSQSLGGTPPHCFFSVAMAQANASLTLSAPNEDSHKVRVFTSYLQGLRRHAIAVTSALSVDEIKQIRDDIRGDEKINIEQNINTDGMCKIYDVLKVNNSEFVDNMMAFICESVKFIKHKKCGVSDERFVVICNDRLHWKENEEDRNQRSRSIHLSKIIRVDLGKINKALKHESLIDIPPCCCFSVITRKASLDLSSPNKDPIQVRMFTSYLKGLARHTGFSN